MPSETEIRKQVEARLRRWGLLVLDIILWVGAAKLLYAYSEYGNFGQFTGTVVLIMVAWVALMGLHTLRTLYVELREWLVKRAIEQARQSQRMDVGEEKHKRDESSRLLIDDDGELIDFPDAFIAEERKHAQRS